MAKIWYVWFRNTRSGTSTSLTTLITWVMNINRFRTEIKWGLIFSIVMMLWMVFERTMGWHDEKIELHPTYTNLFAIVAVIVYVLALRDKKAKDFGGEMTWVQGFVFGLLVSLVVAILTPLSQWITHTLISPDYFENAINYGVEHGLTTVEEAEAHFNLQSYIMVSTIFALITGAVTSAVVSFFMTVVPRWFRK